MEMGNTSLEKKRALVHPPQAKTARAALLFLSLIAIETAPVQAWLMVYAASQWRDASLAAAPFWLLVGVMALFALTRWWLARYGAYALFGGIIFSAIVSSLALIRFSPLMFGNEQLPLLSFSWLGSLFSGAIDSSGLGGVIPLMVYLGWRGFALGGPAPAFSHVSRRFSIGLGALTLALFGSMASPPSSIREVTGPLLALLALEGFGGLSTLALSRPIAGSGSADAVMPGAENSIRWQVSAVVFAFVIVASVTLIGGALNVSAAQSLLAWLGPVGSLLNLIVYWLTQALAYVLYLLSILWLSIFIPTNLPNPPVHSPHAPPSNPKAQHPLVDPAAFAGVAELIVGAFVFIAILFFLYFLARSVVNSLNKSTVEEVEEERERLDASGLLRQQARDLLNRWRGFRGRPAEGDELRRGSMRWLYRELLRAGARAGYDRKASETADEYAARLADVLNPGGNQEADSAANDFRILARAYDDARYGALEDDPPAAGAVAAQSRRATQRISALGKEPAQRGG